MKCLRKVKGNLEIEIIFKNFQITCQKKDAGQHIEVIFENEKFGTLKCPDNYQ